MFIFNTYFPVVCGFMAFAILIYSAIILRLVAWMGQSERAYMKMFVKDYKMIRKIVAFVVIMAVAGVLTLNSGCISSGSKSISDDYMRSKVVKGESTKREVEIMFGKPNIKTDLGSDGEVWDYSYSKTTPLGQKSVDFKIKFNSKGIVERVDESQSDVKVFQN